ncbi:T9SS type A sorting domain-containing protein, partial [Salibacter sp.]|uniref:T9SS type A sorting domain-containing protein n=1 Tax=Salibacter sp. TaxID=2010995 RepID=UPI00287046E7
DQDYEFYVFTVCNSGQSPLAGPGSFTTLTTGLAEQRRDKLKVYPNPAENGFYVMRKQTTNSIITVYNVTGSVVYEKDLTSTLGPVLVPTANWPGGMYVVQLKKNEEILESERVVVR